VFHNVEKEAEELVEEVKLLSWKWTLSIVKVPSFLFYEWNWNPRDCLTRK